MRVDVRRVVPEEYEIQCRDDREDRQEAHDPVDIHEFMAEQVLKVRNRNEIRRAANRRAEAADAAAPADGEQNRHRHAAVGRAAAEKIEHRDGNRAEDGRDDDIWQKDGQHDRDHEPCEHLRPHRRADMAEHAHGNAAVKPRRMPCQAQEVGA